MTTPPNAPEVDAAEVVKMSVLHPRIKREQRDARILAMRGKGETLQAIGDELGLTRARVQQICADSKMPERDLLSWLEATAAYISTPLGMPALGKKISRVSATVADLIEDRDALLTREAALVAERDALRKMWQQAEEDVKALREDALRWREVSDKAWFVDAASYVYGLRTGSFGPTCDMDEVVSAIDAARAEAGHG